MLRHVLAAPAVVALLLLSTGVAHAVGLYADSPLQYTFSDCSADCSQTPSGLKFGVVLPANLAIGIDRYRVEPVAGSTVNFSLLDVSFLLPVPAVNLMLGIGAGSVAYDTPIVSETGGANNLWASVGLPIIRLLDLHVAWHRVNAKVDVGGTSVDLGGTLWSVGAMLNF